MIKFLKENKFCLLIIFLIFLVIAGPYIFTNQFTWTHDSLYHYINIAAMNENIDLSSGKVFADKVIGNIAYDFGWGSGIFYPSFAYYIAVYMFKFLNVIGVSSIFTILKLCDFLAIFLAGFFMYIFCKKVLKNKIAALVSSIIYMTFPYFFIDIFVRGALAEMFLFMFVPMVFLGLEYLLEKDYLHFYIWFVIGYVGAINCHLVLSVYLTIFVLLFLLFNIKKIWDKDVIKRLCVSGLVILGICAPFVIPLCLHTLFGDYTIYIDGLSYTVDKVLDTTISLKDYFSLDKPLAWTGEIVFTISITALFCLIGTLLKFKKIEKGSTLKVYLLFILITLFMLSPLFPWTFVPKMLLNIQFVWRLGLFLAFFVSVCGGYMFVSLRWPKVFASLIVVISLVWVFTFDKMVIMHSYDESEIDMSRQGPATLFYIPAASYKHLDYVEKRSQDIYVLKGEAKIDDVISKTPYLEFDIETKGSVLELPRYYFFGYEATLNGERLSYKENEKGFIEIKVNESGKVILKYTGGVGYEISLWIQMLTISFSLIYIIKNWEMECHG